MKNPSPPEPQLQRRRSLRRPRPLRRLSFRILSKETLVLNRLGPGVLMLSVGSRLDSRARVMSRRRVLLSRDLYHRNIVI